jgi:hypothetical protein
MTPRDAKQFINDNKEALIELSKKLAECKDLTSEKYKDIDNNSRLTAINLVTEWLSEVFQIANPEQIIPDVEEESIFKRLEDNST